jgi:hypothetical protein
MFASEYPRLSQPIKIGKLTMKNRIAMLTRMIHEASTAAADPGISTALRFFGLLDALSSTPPGPSEVYIFTLGASRQAWSLYIWP